MLLTLCMVMSLFAGTTVTASAAEGASVKKRTIPLDVTTLQNITDTDGNRITPTQADSDGNEYYRCEAEGWSFRCNSAEGIYELTLSGVNFDIKDTSDSWAIIAPGKVILADGTENRVSTVSSDKLVAAINAPEITGSGSLTVSATSTSTESGASCYGIYSTKKLTLDQCSIVVDGVTCSSSNGSATGIFAAQFPGTLTITANAAKDNKITIKNVSGMLKTRALGAMKSIVAEGAFVSGAEGTFTSGKTKIISFKDPGTPVIVSFVEPSPEPEAATFTDGLGNTIKDAASYEKGKTKNDKDYTFAGWFGDDGKELDSVESAVAGKTYTAKWTKNGKTVRTTALDLRDATTNQNSTDEGWSWDAGSKTLTFSGATIDIPESNTGAIIAVCLPEGATVKSDANTQNTICNRLEAVEGAIGLMGMGALTIDGSGELSITGKVGGILSMGALTINAPLTATVTDEKGMAVSASGTITLDSSVSIKTPAGGKVCTDRGAFIGDSNGAQAKEVVIGAATPAPTSTFKDGFGNDVAQDALSAYIKNTYKNDKGYTFAGWFDGDGDELDSVDKAETGEIYTAKWTKNGKTVRTTALDLTKISQDNTFGAVLQGSVYTNSAEGWTWDSDKNILTLANVTMDITLSEGTTDTAAVRLPDGAILATAPGTDNNVTVNNNSACAIVGAGKLTIPAAETGKLTVVGGMSGICAKDIIINIPISVSAKDVAVYTEDKGTITIASGLEIKSPIGGKIVASEDASAIYEEDGTTPATNVVIGIAKKYTVIYNTNGGSAVDSATVSEGHKLTAPNAPAKDGYTFHGWYKDAVFTNSWNFDTDTVTGNTTLYAKWAETAKLYGISGTVYASDGTTTASGVSVKLMKGDKQVASATSDSNGAYSFTGVAPGVYNIVAEKDDTTQTTLVIVTNHNETDKNVTLPQSKVNSKLTVNGADTPDVVAGGLDKEAAAVKGANSSATSVKVEMTVESKSDTEVNSTDKTNIETSASGKTLEYLDIKVTKTVDGTESAITTTANMMEIIIPYDMTGKSNITVYRNHGDSATAFTQLSTRPESGAADGTYYLDTVNHLIYVYTQNFSTYAIGYNTQSGGGSGSGGSSSGGSSSSSGGSSSGNSSTISTPSAKNGTVSVSPKSASKGTTVTVTVTPDKGYVLETLTVTDASGKKLDLKNLGSGKYSFTMPASKVEVKATFMEDNTMLNYFVDVPASAYYYDAVLWAAEQGITGGTDATHFSPDGVCTRAQAVTFLWRAAGSPAPSATAMPFTDVADDSYYYNAVLWAIENGITVGTSSTTFSPNLNCSRAQIVTFLWRSEKSPAAGSVNPFTDVSTDAYYADAVLWAVKESVTSGTSPAAFSPDADCTRAQIVTFIYRTLAE